MSCSIKCLKCGETIKSRHVHDFKWCPCKSVAVDGGDEYLRIVGEPSNYQILKDVK